MFTCLFFFGSDCGWLASHEIWPYGQYFRSFHHDCLPEYEISATRRDKSLKNELKSRSRAKHVTSGVRGHVTVRDARESVCNLTLYCLHELYEPNRAELNPMFMSLSENPICIWRTDSTIWSSWAKSRYYSWAEPSRLKNHIVTSRSEAAQKAHVFASSRLEGLSSLSRIELARESCFAGESFRRSDLPESHLAVSKIWLNTEAACDYSTISSILLSRIEPARESCFHGEHLVLLRWLQQSRISHNRLGNLIIPVMLEDLSVELNGPARLHSWPDLFYWFVK